MLKKLFGGKKSNYYLELKEDSNGQAAPTAPSPSTDSAPVTPAPKAETAKAESTPAPAPKAETAKAKSAPAKAAKVEPAAPPKVEPAPAANSNGKVETTAESTFATNYLNTTTSFTTRRRPGANMSSYLNLARQVKKPNV